MIADFALTDHGRSWLVDVLGADPADTADTRAGRRPLARPCLDWTERRPHLAGTAGALVCRVTLDNGWVERIGTGRAVRVTAAGRAALHRLLGIDLLGVERPGVEDL